MRRVILLAFVAAVTAVVTPVGTAGAAQKGKLSGGRCFVEGKAKFSPALGPNQTKGTQYSFTSSAVGAKHAGSESLSCTGTATGKEVNSKGETVAVSSSGPWKGVSAAVSGGKGDLSCALAEDEGGATSTLKLQDTKAAVPGRRTRSKALESGRNRHRFRQLHRTRHARRKSGGAGGVRCGKRERTVIRNGEGRSTRPRTRGGHRRHDRRRIGAARAPHRRGVLSPRHVKKGRAKCPGPRRRGSSNAAMRAPCEREVSRPERVLRAARRDDGGRAETGARSATRRARRGRRVQAVSPARPAAGSSRRTARSSLSPAL
jgi:hypothetical protein